MYPSRYVYSKSEFASLDYEQRKEPKAGNSKYVTSVYEIIDKIEPMASATEEIPQQDFNSTELESESRGADIGEEDEFNRSGDSEYSDESSESQDDVEECVLQEMADLEETFHDMGLNYRMIDRIGEGMAKNTIINIIPNKDLILRFDRNIFYCL